MRVRLPAIHSIGSVFRMKRAWMLDSFLAVVECSLLAERRAAVPLSSSTAHSAAATTSAWLGGARTYGASRTDTEEGLPHRPPNASLSATVASALGPRNAG